MAVSTSAWPCWWGLTGSRLEGHRLDLGADVEDPVQTEGLGDGVDRATSELHLDHAGRSQPGADVDFSRWYLPGRPAAGAAGPLIHTGTEQRWPHYPHDLCRGALHIGGVGVAWGGPGAHPRTGC